VKPQLQNINDSCKTAAILVIAATGVSAKQLQAATMIIIATVKQLL
jgi:hypothetical protein